MTEVTNIRGEFFITLAGEERKLKANFDAIERLENKLLDGTIFHKLQDAMAGNVSFKDLVSVIHTGLICAKDTRMTREQVGKEIFEGGLVNFMQIYMEYLTYCITGGQSPKEGEPGE